MRNISSPWTSPSSSKWYCSCSNASRAYFLNLWNGNDFMWLSSILRDNCLCLWWWFGMSDLLSGAIFIVWISSTKKPTFGTEYIYPSSSNCWYAISIVVPLKFRCVLSLRFEGSFSLCFNLPDKISLLMFSYNCVYKYFWSLNLYVSMSMKLTPLFY